MSGQGQRQTNNNNTTASAAAITTTAATTTATATSTTTSPSAIITTTVAGTHPSGGADIGGAGIGSGANSASTATGTATGTSTAGTGISPSSRTVTTLDDLVHPLSMYKCQPYLKDSRGRNALMLAAEMGHLEVLDTCLRIGMDFAGDITGRFILCRFLIP